MIRAWRKTGKLGVDVSSIQWIAGVYPGIPRHGVHLHSMHYSSLLLASGTWF